MYSKSHEYWIIFCLPSKRNVNWTHHRDQTRPKERVTERDPPELRLEVPKRSKIPSEKALQTWTA